MREERQAILPIQGEYEFRVGVTLEGVAEGLEGETDVVIVVELAVDYGVDGPVGGVEGLVTRLREVVDGESAMGEG